MSDNTLGDLTNNSDMHNLHLKKSNILGFKEDNTKEILKAKLDIRNQPQNNSLKPPHSRDEDFEKENTQVAWDREDRSTKINDNESSGALNHSTKISENDEDGPFGVLAERRKNIKYAMDEDSPEENSEEDEKENAMNKLKALLGNSRSKSDSNNTNQHQNKNSSSKDKNNNDFIHIIDRMKMDLFRQLYITDPDEMDEDEEGDVSRIFYDGRDGQQHTIEVLQRFFKSLKMKAKQFAHHYESVAESLKLQHQPRSQEVENNRPEEDDESDRDRIKRKLNEGKKQAPKQNQSSKEGLKSLLSKSKAPK